MASIAKQQKQLEKRLKKVARKVEKAAKKSTRKAAESVRERYRELAPKETGALADAPFVRPFVADGVVGHEVVIDRNRLVEERRSRGGRIGHDAQRGEDLFYAAVVEFDENGNKPLRSALAAEQGTTVDRVRREVRAAIREGAKG